MLLITLFEWCYRITQQLAGSWTFWSKPTKKNMAAMMQFCMVISISRRCRHMTTISHVSTVVIMDCEALTSPEGISACRASWTFDYHTSQKALVSCVKCNLDRISVKVCLLNCIISHTIKFVVGLCPWPGKTRSWAYYSHRKGMPHSGWLLEPGPESGHGVNGEFRFNLTFLLLMLMCQWCVGKFRNYFNHHY